MDKLLHHVRDPNGIVQRTGPYMLLEILLPGGTLLALLLLLYRSASRGFARPNDRDGLEPLSFLADR